MVLLYSARLRRRTANRPAPPLSSSSAVSSQELMVSSSSPFGSRLSLGRHVLCSQVVGHAEQE